MIKIKLKGIMAILSSSLFIFLFIFTISCAKQETVKPNVKENAEKAFEELKQKKEDRE